MSGPNYFVEIECEDGSHAWLRAEEITTVLERNTQWGRLITIPTRSKTLMTRHTFEDLHATLKAAFGGGVMHIHKVPAAPFPPPEEMKAALKPVSKGKAAA